MARRPVSLNALRAFEAAGRHGRMTLAAEELNVTHGAVSRQVQHLENILGVALFEGPKNGQRLTDAGSKLLASLIPAFDQLDMAVRMVADTQEGPLDVSCPGTFTMRWLIPRLYRFRAIQPNIDVRLTASSKPVDFSRDGFDVAIRVGSGLRPEGAEVIPLFKETIGPVLTPALADAEGHDLSRIARLHSRTRRHAWKDWCERSGKPLDDAAGAEYEHFYFMLEAARSGLGVCIAPWPFVSNDIKSGRLVAPYKFIESGQEIVALRRNRRHRKSMLFCDWLKREADEFMKASAEVT